MVFRADRLNAQSGADGGASKAGLGRQIWPSEAAGEDTPAARPGSDREESSAEWGTHPASATAQTTDSRRGMRSQVILDSQVILGSQVILE